MTGNLTQAEISEVLKNNIIGRIGCSAEGTTYIVPVSYVYLGSRILCHSRDGKKIGMMRINPSVCFEVDEINDYNNWRCIIAEGSYEELNNDDDIREAKDQFRGLTAHVKLSETAMPPSERTNPEAEDPRTDSTIYYFIHLKEISGRYERVK